MKTLPLHSWLNYSWWMWQGLVVKDARSHAVSGPITSTLEGLNENWKRTNKDFPKTP